MTAAATISALLCVLAALQVVGAVATVARAQTPSEAFKTIVQIGRASTSNDEPRQIAVTSTGVVLVAGKTSPFSRRTESDLGLALDVNLSDEDVFLARFAPASSPSSPANTSVFRIGTGADDQLRAMLVLRDGNVTYLAGGTHGSFSGILNAGQSDLFIVKLRTDAVRPVHAWIQPLVRGTSSSESVTALAHDPTNSSLVYATGYTTGGLFGAATDTNAVLSDAIVFAFSADDGSIVYQRQFGTAFSDYGNAIVVSSEKDGPIFVSVVTERKYGDFSFGNFHLYKFTRSLSPLGDVLLRSFSRESVSAFVSHPILDDSLLVSGYSLLDEVAGYDLFVKRVVRPFNAVNMGSSEIAVDEVRSDEYTHRWGSGEKTHDYATDMLVHPSSGRLLVGGYTSGTLAKDIENGGEAAPFIACVDPIDASMSGVSQKSISVANTWIGLEAMVLSDDADSVYYAFKELDLESNQFFTSIGLFRIPDGWTSRIVVPPTPSPSGFPTTKNFKSIDTKGFSKQVIIVSVVGGISLILAIVSGVMLWRWGSNRNAKDRLAFGRKKAQTETSGLPPARIVPRGEREEVQYSGLV